MRKSGILWVLTALAAVLLLAACQKAGPEPNTQAERDAAAEQELAAARAEDARVAAKTPAADPTAEPVPREGQARFSETFDGTNVQDAEERARAQARMEGTGRFQASVDRADVLLYRDDTALVYTVKTTKDCAAVTLSLLYHKMGLLYQFREMDAETRASVAEQEEMNPWLFNQALVQRTFAASDAGVNVAEKADELVWTIPCDFGRTGAERVLAEAKDASGAVLDFGVVPVNIRYPEINTVDAFEEAIRQTILFNRDEPYYFICDLKNTSLDLAAVSPSDYGHAASYGMLHTVCSTEEDADKEYLEDMQRRIGLTFGDNWAYILRDPAVCTSDIMLRPTDYAMLLTTPATEAEIGTAFIPMTGLFVPENGTTVLCGMRFGNEDPLRPDADPNWLRIQLAPGVRAVVCERAGVTVNEADFPSAAAVQRGVREAIAACIRDGMTDFEKARAIHDWMYARGKTAVLPENYDGMREQEQSLCVKTVYGFLTYGFGDCMGWSDAFRTLCNMAGVPCATIDCKGSPGGEKQPPIRVDHRANIVWLDGEAYWVDAYWDAAGSGYDKDPYSYFLLTGEQAAKFYSWSVFKKLTFLTSERYAVDPATGERLHGA